MLLKSIIIKNTKLVLEQTPPELSADIVNRGIVLTGGLMRFDDVSDFIKERCSWIAPIAIYEGEYEQEALALNALSVLTGEEKPNVYTGKPVWDGFKD